MRPEIQESNAVHLADELERKAFGGSYINDAANELRRLHKLNGAPAWTPITEPPPDTGTSYQVLALCAKRYEGGNYDGEPKRGVYQDWVLRQWPQNYLFWMPIPPLPVASAKRTAQPLDSPPLS